MGRTHADSRDPGHMNPHLQGGDTGSVYWLTLGSANSSCTALSLWSSLFFPSCAGNHGGGRADPEARAQRADKLRQLPRCVCNCRTCRFHQTHCASSPLREPPSERPPAGSAPLISRRPFIASACKQAPALIRGGNPKHGRQQLVCRQNAKLITG